MPRFVDALWEAATPVYDAILAHPFLQGLTDGTLPEAAFRHYVIQDAHYLRDYGRGIAVFGARAADDADFMTFCRHAAGAVAVEGALHESFFQDWNLTPEILRQTPVAPNCLLYTSYLLRVAYERPYHEALAAFLPCYWIYAEVGKALIERGSPHPLYQKWIAMYGGEEFAQLVKEAIDATERVSADLTPSQRAAMIEHFVQCARCEWLFWDMGWNEQTWPV